MTNSMNMKPDIILFSEKLVERVKKDLAPLSADDLATASKAYHLLHSVLNELLAFEFKYSFKSCDEEIKFLKELKPAIMSLYFFHKKKFSIILFDSFNSGPDIRVRHYYKVLEKIKRFTLANEDFFRYCLSGESHRDREFFICHSTNMCLFGRAQTFDVKLSRLLSNEMLKDFLIQLIGKASTHPEVPITNLRWTDSKVAMIELIYAIQTAGIIDNGKAEIKQIVTAFQQLFNIDLGNYARVFAEIRMRKNGQTTFLDRIKESLIRRIEELEQ